MFFFAYHFNRQFRALRYLKVYVRTNFSQFFKFGILVNDGFYVLF